MISPTVNETKFEMAFTSKSILVQKEVDAFSFGSLVADCGGVLGLFIGFNFLMIWDWTITAVSNFKQKYFDSESE